MGRSQEFQGHTTELHITDSSNNDAILDALQQFRTPNSSRALPDDYFSHPTQSSLKASLKISLPVTLPVRLGTSSPGPGGPLRCTLTLLSRLSVPLLLTLVCVLTELALRPRTRASSSLTLLRNRSFSRFASSSSCRCSATSSYRGVSGTLPTLLCRLAAEGVEVIGSAAAPLRDGRCEWW